MRRINRHFSAALAALPVAAALTIVTASPASAAGGCSGNGGAHTDVFGNTYGTTKCNVYTSGYIRYTKTNSGYLYAGTNWFVCQEKFPGVENPAVGSARNDYWLYTQGDVGYSHSGWGWFPATKVSGGSNYGPVPGLHSCDDYPVFAFPSP
jgi:hypothetical protein